MTSKDQEIASSNFGDGRVDNMEIVKASFFTPTGNLFTEDGSMAWGMPIIFIGPPGSSKTSAFYKFAFQYGIPFETLKPGSRGEGFFGCTPTVGEYNGQRVLDFPIPRRFAERYTGNAAALILIDEALNTPPAVKPAILGFLQERELGTVKFSPRARIFACANSVEESAAGYDLTPPEANRLGHMPWPDPSTDSVISFLSQGAGRSLLEENRTSVEAEEKRVLEAWPNAMPTAVGYVAGFLNRRPDMLRQQPKVSSPAASGAWASPRTWEYATRALASSKVHGLNETAQEAFIAAFLGQAVANEFSTWRRQQDLPLPQDVLTGAVKFKHSRTRLDKTACVLHSCCAYVTQPMIPDRNEMASAMWKLLESTLDDAADLALPVAKNMFDAKLANVPGAIPVLSKLEFVATVSKKR